MLTPNAVLGVRVQERETRRDSLIPQAPAWEFILDAVGSSLSLGIGSISLVRIPNVDIGNEGNMESTFLLDGNNLANIILDKMYTGQLLKEVVHVNTTE